MSDPLDQQFREIVTGYPEVLQALAGYASPESLSPPERAGRQDVVLYFYRRAAAARPPRKKESPDA